MTFKRPVQYSGTSVIDADENVVCHCYNEHDAVTIAGALNYTPPTELTSAEILAKRKARIEQASLPEALQKRDAAGAVLLALVGLKLYKDHIGKDAHYESEQPKAWALAKEYLQRAMPEEYAMVEAALSMRSPLACSKSRNDEHA